MEHELETPPVVALKRRSVRRTLLTHGFVTLLVLGAIVGGVLRFVPTGSASASNSAGQTACAAT
jgi:hypothetical protein